MKRIKLLVLLLVMLVSFNGISQVGVNTTSPTKDLDEMTEFFGVDLLEELEIFKNELEKEKVIKEKFNGKIIMDLYPDLKGKELGQTINNFKSSFDNWDEFVYDSSSETVMERFNKFIHLFYS